MTMKRTTADLNVHIADTKKLQRELKRHGIVKTPFDSASIPPGTFEAAEPRPPKLPDVSVQVSVDTILGVDAALRNAIFQMGLGDKEGVRRCIQSAIAKIQPAFEETGKAFARTPAPDVKPVFFIMPADLKGKVEPWVRAAILNGTARWMTGFEDEGDMKAILAARDKAARFRWPASWGTELGD